jgi:hypothetical protein
MHVTTSPPRSEGVEVNIELDRDHAAWLRI